MGVGAEGRRGDAGVGQIRVDRRHLKQENHRSSGRDDPHGALRLSKEPSRFSLEGQAPFNRTSGMSTDPLK